METPDSRTLTLHPIGFLRTSHAQKVDAPRQPAAAAHTPGVIQLLPGMNLEHAIEDLAGWERIWVIAWFDRNTGWRPKVLPPRSTSGRKGVLATRSPHRPNPLGLSVFRLAKIEGLDLHVLDVDLLDGTPILDIKPYVPYTDAFPDSGSGWLARDPKPTYTIAFTPTAEQQLAWLAPRIALPLRERIVATLSLGPQPHPYRRIKTLRDGRLQLAVQDWRVDFEVRDLHVQVTGIRSGYSREQLNSPKGLMDEAMTLHREYGEWCSSLG